jgi:hypothetical protein
LYRLFFDLFGTGVSQKVVYGGLIYMQTAVKKCYGGNINEDTIKELEKYIHNESPGSLSYLRYRRLGVKDIRGGNPEIADLQARISTFSLVPAVISMSYKSLEQLVPQVLQQAVQEALKWYTNSISNWKQELQARVEQERVRRYRDKRFIRVFIVTQGNTIVNKPDPAWHGACGYCPLLAFYAVPTCVFEKDNGWLAAGESFEMRKFFFENTLLARVVRHADTGHTELIVNHPNGSQFPQGAFDGPLQNIHTNFYIKIPVPFGGQKTLSMPVELYIVQDCEPIIENVPPSICNGIYNRKFSCTCAGY